MKSTTRELLVAPIVATTHVDVPGALVVVEALVVVACFQVFAVQIPFLIFPSVATIHVDVPVTVVVVSTLVVIQ